MSEAKKSHVRFAIVQSAVQEHRWECRSQLTRDETIAAKIGCLFDNLLGRVKREEIDIDLREAGSSNPHQNSETNSCPAIQPPQ